MVALLWLNQESWSQKLPVKWGKVTAEEWNMQEVFYDPEAPMVILCDFGVAQFSGSRLKISYHRRIKILKPEGIEEANVQLPYYAKDRVQSVGVLKAQTLKQVGGKTQSQALSSKDFFEKDLSEEWKMVNFTFPDVEVGSILEYSYVLTSENVVFLRSWDFQKKFPVAHSEFRATIPEYLDYKVFFQGTRLLQKYGQKPSSEWFLKNLPSLKPEPYMTTMEDFKEKLRFQLAGYYTDSGIPGNRHYETLMTTWPALGYELMSQTSFGSQLGKKSLAKNILANLDLSGKTPRQKSIDIYNYVSNTISWDGEYEKLAEHDLKEVLERKEGSSAEINLLLALLLSNADIKADPVLISTREHGRIAKNIPLLTQFNQVIVRVEIEGEAVLMDATDKMRPYNLLAEEDLNHDGLLIQKGKEPQWIEITPNPNNVRSVNMILDLQDLENPKANFECSVNGYFAMSVRKRVASGEKSVIRLVQNSHAPNLEYGSLGQLEKPLRIASDSFDIELMDNGDLVYVQPMLINYYQENPFKSPTRNYPIDFGSPFKEIYSVSVLIPEGYSVDEAPESAAIKLPGGYGYFTFQTQVSEGKVNILARLGISKPTMGYGIYGGLQEFYDILITKFSEQLVLRRD